MLLQIGGWSCYGMAIFGREYVFDSLLELMYLSRELIMNVYWYSYTIQSYIVTRWSKLLSFALNYGVGSVDCGKIEQEIYL